MKLGKVSNRRIMKQVLVFILCGAAGWFLKGRLSPNTDMMGMGVNQDTYVLATEVSPEDVTPQKSFIGHVEAIKSVNLKPQVTGYVEKILFQEGSLVQEGDILLIIEQKRYLANVELRKAELQSANANLVQTERNFKRQSSLSKQNYASKATFDSAESNYLQAQAAVSQAKANLDLAEIDLNYTEIKAPITGYIGKALVTEGNYVSSTALNLARIIQTSPIRVVFSVSDKDFLNSKILHAKNGEYPFKTQVVLPNGQVLYNNLRSVFTDNEINSQTATIAIYAEYENVHHQLIPGNYVDIKLSSSSPIISITIPQAALGQDEHGNYVMVVSPDNIAEERRVTLGDIIEDRQIVTEGLTSGEKIIIQGLQKVRNGSKVKAAILNKTAPTLITKGKEGK